MACRAVRFIVIAILLGLPCTARALDVGDTAKDFALTDSAGNIFTLNEATRGAPATILEFISVYCEACQKKAPYMNRLATQYGPRGLRIIAVALANDQQETAGLIKDWSITYAVIPDPDKKTFYLYGIHKVPQVYVIDGSGIIRYKGNADKTKDIEKIIEELLQQKSGGEASAPEDGLANSPVKVGDKAPAAPLSSLKGEPAAIQFSNDAPNVIIAFLSASDSSNRELAGMLCGLAGTGTAGARVYGILPQGVEKAGDGLARSCPGMRILLDRQGEAFKKYGIAKAPEIMILSRSGYVRRRNAPQTAAALAELLKPAVAGEDTIDAKQLAAYLRKAMPDSYSIRPVTIGNGETIYIGDTRQGKRLARVVKKDILCEVCTDVFFIMTIDENGIYKNITLVKPFELSGKTIDASSFTRQFIGKSFRETFAPGRNVDGITGATKSCAKFVEGLNETQSVLGELKKPPFKDEFIQTVCFLNQSELESALQEYQQQHRSSAGVSVRDLAPLCPGGRLPQCPAGGSYSITSFNSIPRVICSKHGLDPRSSMIH